MVLILFADDDVVVDDDDDDDDDDDMSASYGVLPLESLRSTSAGVAYRICKHSSDPAMAARCTG